MQSNGKVNIQVNINLIHVSCLFIAMSLTNVQPQAWHQGQCIKAKHVMSSLYVVAFAPYHSTLLKKGTILLSKKLNDTFLGASIFYAMF